MELIDIKGVGAKVELKLNGLGIYTLEDLATFLPKSYCDMTHETLIGDLKPGEFYYVKATVTKLSKLYMRSRTFNLFTCYISDGKDNIKCMWYNSPYLRANLEIGKEYYFYGKIQLDGKTKYFSNPSFESSNNPSRLTGVVPIYPVKGKIGQPTIRKFILEALDNVSLISLVDKVENFKYKDALKMLHSPNSMQDVFVAKNRLAKDYLTYEILAYKLTRGIDNIEASYFIQPESIIEDDILKLPYQLTKSQEIAVKEIIENLKSPGKINHLLIGDVGSGKTVVALLTMAYAVKNGCQTAIMAPTEILAKQHYETAKSLFKDEFRIALLTSSTPLKEKKEILTQTKSGDIDMLIGTHAIIGDKVDFYNLKYVVIDELHKFGVRQKSKLETKAKGIDTLVMSATPIPRMLAISIYGDVKISQIQPRENTQGNISTFIIGDDKLKDLYKFILERVDQGEQAYIVCPLVEDSEGLQMYSAKDLYKELTKGAFKNINVGLLHGKMKQSEKDEVMNNFYNGLIDVLIATSIIEVGIDSQRASVIAVLNSDRFGLAGLHQIRGRVGRKAGLKSYCFLHTQSGEEKERLLAIKDNQDGLAIAEIDAQIRGYGDFFGFNQSGGGWGNSISKSMLEKCTMLADDLIKNNIEQINNDERLKNIMLKVKEISLA